MGSREDKQLELATDILLQRVNEMKNSLHNLILKVELDYENFSFPDALDSFAVISGQMNSIMKLLKSDKIPNLRGLIAIPLKLNPDIDPDLQQITEGRLTNFDHAVVPDYLRTKPEPEIESKHNFVEQRGTNANPDTVAKQAAALTKMANHILDLISSARDEWEAAERGGLPPTSSVVDTQELVHSLYTGKAFKVAPPPPIQRQGPQSSQAPPPVPQATAKSTIKTTIKPGRNY